MREAAVKRSSTRNRFMESTHARNQGEARRRIADAELANFDFGDDLMVSTPDGGWSFDGSEEFEPGRLADRLYTTVCADVVDGPLLRCQFNVWFERGTNEVCDVYEGDWH